MTSLFASFSLPWVYSYQCPSHSDSYYSQSYLSIMISVYPIYLFKDRFISPSSATTSPKATIRAWDRPMFWTGGDNFLDLKWVTSYRCASYYYGSWRWTSKSTLEILSLLVHLYNTILLLTIPFPFLVPIFPKGDRLVWSSQSWAIFFGTSN